MILTDTDLPIVSAPMAFASAVDLASAVTAASAFGMIGAGRLVYRPIED